MATRMQQRRGTAAQWTSYNPILNAGEIGYESDTNKFKIGDGANQWSDLSYFVDADTLIDGAPGLLDTLNELAAAIGDDPYFITTIANNLASHESDTTNIHGIADTSILATTNTVQTLSNKTIGLGSNTFSGTLAQFNTALSDTNFVSTDGTETLTNKTISAADNTVTINSANIVDITASASEINILNGVTLSTTELNYLDGVTSSVQSQLDSKVNSVDLPEAARDAISSALTAGTGITITPDDNADTITVAVTSNTYDAYGAASTVATNLSNHESDTSTHGVTEIVGTSETQTLTNKTLTSPKINEDVVLTATASELNVLDGITASTIELNYIDGVTSSIQSQIDGKASLSGASFTGAISTSDSTASSSTSTGSIIAGGGIGVAGNAYIGGDLTISGDFTVNGTTTTVSTQDLVVQDPLIYVGENNTANSVDLGIIASFNDGSYQHTGLVRDSSAGTWKLFKGVTDEPTTTVNFAQGSLDDLSVAGLSATSITVGDVSNTEFGYLNGVTSAIQTQIDGKISSSSSDTLTNKTISLGSNTVSGTIAQFNTAVTDADLATIAGSETLTNKTINGENNTLTVRLTNDVTGTLPIANGGTGQTTAMAAATALLPSQTGNSGKYLTNDGSGTLSWETVSGYLAPTLGSTSIASGATVTTISGLTLSGATLTGSLTANGSTGTSGYYLKSTGTGVEWAAVSAGGGGASFSELMLIGS